MIRSYLKTSFRNLFRHKLSAAFNVLGLTLGVASSLVLFLMISFLSSFDDYHSKRDRIFRIVSESKRNHGFDYQPGVPAVLPDAFRADFPEAIEVVFASYRAGAMVVIPRGETESLKFREGRGVVYTEPSFFKVFDRETLAGDPITGLDEPNEAVISSMLALKYFGHDEVIGKIIEFEKRLFTIKAVVADAPPNTDLPFDLMLSYATVKREREEPGWHSVWSDEQCYFLLNDRADIASVRARLGAFTKKYLGDEDADRTTYHAQPLPEMHYDTRYSTYSYNTVPSEILIALGVIGLVLIITACVNFINLTTAEAIRRSREVGVRKSLGSTRAQLVTQFLGETAIVTGISVVLAIGLAQVALEFLNPLLDMPLSLDLSNISLWMFVVALTAGVSLMAGLYPAFVISGFKPVLVLKNKVSNKGSSGYHLRRALVVLQFFISQTLIIITVVLIQQMDFWEERDLGFAKEGIITVSIPEPDVSAMRTLRDELTQFPGVGGAALCSAPPSSGSTSRTNVSVEGAAEELTTQVKQVDGNYLDLFKLQLIAGKGLADLDTALGYVVNEEFARLVGFQGGEGLLGKTMTIWGRTWPIVGVVRDFHTTSLAQPIEPTVLFNRAAGYRTLSIGIDVRSASGMIDVIREKWEAAYPEHIFEYTFLDESIRRFYEGQRILSGLLVIFTSMAIFIGCLGLFGLAVFMANQKTKEIGVRKVLGASVSSIIYLFAKEFVVLILVGFAFAAPLSWWATQEVLNQFAYKIDPGPGVLVFGLMMTLAIALITVGYRSLRAATANPVSSLRYE